MGKIIQKDIFLYIFLIILGVGGIAFALTWPETIGFGLFTICASLAGLGVTFNIYYSKRYKEHLACPTGSDCNAVVNSKYAKFFGIPLEYLGMAYYTLVFLSYTGFLLLPSLKESLLFPFVLLLTFGAFLFSLYLITIQAFVLKKWCIWCLLSAALSIGIFLASLTSLSFAGAILVKISALLLFLRSFGFVLSLGGSLTSLFLFAKFLEDRHIDDKEASVFKGISELIWVGVGLIFVGNLALYEAVPHVFWASGIFVVQVVAMIVAFVAGAVLSVMFAPFVTVMPFEKRESGGVVSLSFLRRGLIFSGSIAVSSLFFAFALDYLSMNASKSILFTTYAFVLVASLVVGAAFNRKVIKEGGEGF